jgi:GAF domain-containing protein
MKRRSRAGGGKRTKMSRQTVKPNRHKPPHEAIRSTSSASEEGDVARLTRELHQALAQQAATSEVLGVISSSPGELERVFQSILQKATHICEANFGILFRFDGKALQSVAQFGTPSELIEAQTRLGLTAPGGLLDQVNRTKRVIHTTDRAADPTPGLAARFGRPRSVVGVPMLKDGALIGAIIIYGKKFRPFTDKQIEFVQSFADQAVIAIENARLLNELRQSLEQQTATSHVLQVISSSPGDLEPVFATMLEKAVRICEAKFGTLYLHEGGRLRLVAAHDVPEFLEARGSSPVEPAPGGVLDVAMRTKRTVHLPDLAATQSYAERHPRMVEAVELGGIRTVVAVPMLKDDDFVGVIAVHRREVRPFTDKQIELVQNFAAQAVIAIENARLLNELRQRTTDLTERTADLTEALEQQTATSEVLQVISGSPGDVEPVFSTMLEKAVRICDASFGNIYRWDGKALNLVATHNTPPAFAEARGRSTLRPGSNSLIGRMLATKAVVHIADVAATQAYEQRVPETVEAVELGRVRTILGVPMRLERELIGSFTLYRTEVSPFTDKQIALVTNFANQAVIAVENARLLNELRQSLEQQTATAQVLQVISSSTGDLAHVFATMLENATRICAAKFGTLYLKEGDGFRATVMHNAPRAYEEVRAHLVHPSPHTTLWQAANTKRPFQIADVTRVL